MSSTTLPYCLAWLFFFAFSFTMFPVWHENTFIPTIPLLGTGAWLYGRTRGLLLIIPALFFNALLLSGIHADLARYPMAKLPGVAIYIVAVLFIGTLRQNLEAFKEANERLDQTVSKRNLELSAVARKLLEHSESMRTLVGQELHDGIGQQLTGIQLYVASLAEQLCSEHCPCAEMARALSNRAQTTHNLVRRAARSLFPVQIPEVGLLPALRELAAGFEDLRGVRITVASFCEPEVSHETALQCFRICQDALLLILNQTQSKTIYIGIDTTPSSITLSISYNGTSIARQMADSTQGRLIDYRLLQIQGTMEIMHTSPKTESLVFEAPHPERTLAA
ncbi:Signal transduction histidine-protein kinase/phosphatase DegS [Pontiella desulfatans]|uniref:histidine kinase n=1 Tax=Pontiella desulfatans TaxID=2750659 RepID=A0A6C2UDE5_PONDE|nr:histidine kinase [Pontiella desulfatans]VGO17236.1 Signal transduction histidine-protein kinase/phosphatase DegS [Pontiella desulfatans]